MMKLKNKAALLLKRAVAVFMCGVFVASGASGMQYVHATDATTTEAAASTDNADANGKLGKNSDLGIELTKSITGKANDDVKIQFKLISNDPDTVKIKSVYPVIDNTFPFETSGDAYKVISAGTDVEKQKSLDAAFKMHTRSDISTGYQSVRFIAEYAKTGSDGTVQDFYIIKTINIYFSSASDSVNTGKKPQKGSANGSDDDSGSGSDDDGSDDDGSDGGSGGGYSSGGDDGSDEEATAPKLVITGYETKPEKIMAGEKFTLTIHIKNTSKSTSLCNGKFLIGNEAGTFLPTNGSSAVFIEKIEPDKTGDLKIDLKTSADLAQKNYILVVKGDFDDGKGNNFTSSDNLSLPVFQEVKLGITDVSMTPESLAIGGEGSLMFTINNKGTAGVYNVNVSVKEDAVSCEETYVGNIAGSSSAYATLNVTGQNDNSATGMVTVVITYEDSEGNKGTMEEQVACYVGEEVEMEEYSGEGMDEFEEEPSGLPLWLIIVLAVIALAVVVVIIVLIVKRRKKRMAELLAEEDDDDFGDDFMDAAEERVEADDAAATEDNNGEDDIKNEDF